MDLTGDDEKIVKCEPSHSPGTEPLPVWESSAVLAHQGTGVALRPAGGHPGEGDPVPGPGP